MPVTPVVKGGFWDEAGGLTLESDSFLKRRIGALYNKNGLRALKKIEETLTGAAPGANATATYKRVSARENAQGELGGRRTIETVTDVNRATTAADVTEIKEEFLKYQDQPIPYPTSKDGNPRNYPGG